jgi:hypothetical protein
MKFSQRRSANRYGNGVALGPFTRLVIDCRMQESRYAKLGLARNPVPWCQSNESVMLEWPKAGKDLADPPRQTQGGEAVVASLSGEMCFSLTAARFPSRNLNPSEPPPPPNQLFEAWL